MNIEEELEGLVSKKVKLSCCQSYMLPKGRCYDCVEEGACGEEE